MLAFEGKVAVVTGAASGIGLALAKAFLAQGMKVVFGDIDPALAGVVAALDEPDRTLSVECDVSDPEQVEGLATSAVEHFGTVHILCNNAGTGGPCAIRDLSLGDWKYQLDVNLWGVIHGIRYFLPILERQNEGHIVNVSSMGGVHSMPFIAPYNAAKAAVVALTESLQMELAMGGSNVHVSVLCTGAVVSRMNDEPNVPERHKMSARPGSPPIEQFRKALRESFETTAMAPETVAERVLEAIRRDSLYIMTHPEFAPPVQERFDAIMQEIHRYA